MKQQSPYKVGDTINIYEDWENETQPLGAAKLVKLQALGRSFILEDTMPEKEQVVYSYEEWIVEMNNKQFRHKLRFVDAIGITNSREDLMEDEMPEAEYNRLIQDSFIIINGKSVF
jgi:hypothetical protein